MKYLDYPELEDLARSLTFESTECKVFTRLESYSCKAVKKEKRLFKHLERQYATAASMSQADQVDESLASPFGRLDDATARKTLFTLIATLNGAFPDHDFSDVNPADFKRETSSVSVLSSLATTMTSLQRTSNAPRSFSSYPSSYDAKEASPSSLAISPNSNGIPNINHPQMASALDDIMHIAECEVYSFHPDAESDPHACADPEEEGYDLFQDRFADDDDDDDEEAWSSGDGDEGPSTTMSTPRRHDDSIDAPMFDEDLIGSGFTPSSSQATSSQPTTPRTPAPARSRPPFSARKKPAAVKASDHSTSLGGSSSSYSEEDDDVDEGLHGLLWATYAFFYNRHLRRILFVSVWSRRNGVRPSYSFSPPSYPSMAYSHPLLHNFVLDDADTSSTIESTSAPSPAKRAIAKSTAKSKRRSLSSSPAPSALSPFPHNQSSSKLNPLIEPIQSMTIADALKKSQPGSNAPTATIRVPTSNAKRTVDGNTESPREQTRKQRKVSNSKGPGKPLAT